MKVIYIIRSMYLGSTPISQSDRCKNVHGYAVIPTSACAWWWNYDGFHWVYDLTIHIYSVLYIILIQRFEWWCISTVDIFSGGYPSLRFFRAPMAEKRDSGPLCNENWRFCHVSQNRFTYSGVVTPKVSYSGVVTPGNWLFQSSYSGKSAIQVSEPPHFW